MGKEVYRLVKNDEQIALQPASLKDVWLENRYAYLVDMMESILFVAERYYYHYHFVHYERAFAYELYHQWSKHIEKYHKAGNEAICLNAEVKKFLAGQKKLPDMVLHEDCEDNQEIVVEIKRMSSATPKSIIDDLKKIERFLTGIIGIGDTAEKTLYGFSPYKFGALLVTCGTIDNLADLLIKKGITLSRITKRLKDAYKEGHLYCICSPQSGSIQYSTLETLVDYIETKRKGDSAAHSNIKLSNI